MARLFVLMGLDDGRKIKVCSFDLGGKVEFLHGLDYTSSGGILVCFLSTIGLEFYQEFRPAVRLLPCSCLEEDIRHSRRLDKDEFRICDVGKLIVLALNYGLH